jgi:hypothetical protein
MSCLLRNCFRCSSGVKRVTMERSWRFFALMFVLAEWIEPADLALNNRNQITYFNRPYEIKRENNHTIVKPEPPPHELVAKMARYIVHNSGKVKFIIILIIHIAKYSIICSRLDRTCHHFNARPNRRLPFC